MTPEGKKRAMRSRLVDWILVAAGCGVLLGIYYAVTDKWLARLFLALVSVPLVVWLQRRHRSRSN
jgi:predicted PurR-regulated permease PerM